MMAPPPLNNRTQLLNYLWYLQDTYGCIREEDTAYITRQLGISGIDLEGVISFYHFLHRDLRGKYTIYLNNSIVSLFSGFAKARQAFESGAGTLFGHVDLTGTFGLFETSCIGLSDQEPAALINFRPFTNLTPQKVFIILQELRAGKSLDEICDRPLLNIRYTPPKSNSIFFRDYEIGKAVKSLRNFSQEDIIELIRLGKLTGLGGAFFPTHMKWQSCYKQKDPEKYIVCNADEGEPGTFKDRVLMQALPGLVIEGMIIAGYAVGAQNGAIYLRAEYRYLHEQLQHTLEEFREAGLLGKNIGGIKGFDFDIFIQLGAGAYVCGEETALLESMEGKRGEPRPKLYFPTEKGFRAKPTVVNNVETFAAAARVLELGSEAFLKSGTKSSAGNKILSVSGDCNKPGIFEIPWGITLGKLMELCEAIDPHAIQMGGPAGELVSIKEKNRKICLEDLRCGGSVMIFNRDRDLMDILSNYNQFFAHESCGICTPCRGGNYIISRQLKKIRLGLADQSDLEQLHAWGKMMRITSRCGLGQTAPNSYIQAIDKFPDYFETIIKENDIGLNKHFDVEQAVQDYNQIIQKNRT
jgi:[NiFe] hydrogenase diaphorase moiety large subunit